jgi:HAAS domain-containing protein
MTAPHADQIIAGYLARLQAALAPLPEGRRRELIEDVSAHIAEARGALAEETDADLLNILDRLGDPSETAAEEMAGSRAASEAPGTPSAGRQNLLEILAIVLLLVFWPAGVVLLWISDLWTTRDKLIGTLVPPGGYYGIFLLGPILLLHPYTCDSWSGSTTGPGGQTITTSGTTCPPGVVMALLGVLGAVVVIAILASPIFTAVYLGRRLKRRRGTDPRQGAEPQPRLVG